MLPYQFKPTRLHDLVRIGPQEDGGYVIPDRILNHCTLLVGFGLSDDWRFEKEFQNRSGAIVHCYDHTVTLGFWVKTWVINATAVIAGRFRRFHRLLDPIRYCWFFNGRTAIHHRQRVGYRQIGDVDVHEVMELNKDQDIFIKMDIEGSEYRILDQLLDYPNRIKGFVVELHDTDLFGDRIMKFLEKASNSYELVHVHANNNAPIAPSGIPFVLELTWVSKSLLGNEKDIEAQKYPIKGLDFPNFQRSPDIDIEFESRPSC